MTYNFNDLDNSDKWYLKDQRKLVEKCQAQDIPVFCICGNDINAIPALREYINSAEKHESGNPEFVEGLKLLLADFQEYQTENPEDIKVPD